VLDAGGLRLALVRAETLSALGARPGGAPGAVAVSFNVDTAAQVDAVVARLPDAVDRGPHPPPWGGWAAWLRDPDGHLVEVVWNPRLA
jgi:catechol 2,3-dioxygenase-like lactoylglutathione lyase family enzyme